MKKIYKKIIFFLLVIIFIVLFIRFVSPRQLDDVTLGISCEKELMENSDVLYVIPKFNNISISENKTWCKEILSLNKTLAMHGVYHTYNEFLEDKNDSYLKEGMDIFKKCFGFYPEYFKPSQIKISKNNKILIKRYMKLNLYMNEIFHKSFHCSDTGKFSNKFIEAI